MLTDQQNGFSFWSFRNFQLNGCHEITQKWSKMNLEVSTLTQKLCILRWHEKNPKDCVEIAYLDFFVDENMDLVYSGDFSVLYLFILFYLNFTP